MKHFLIKFKKWILGIFLVGIASAAIISNQPIGAIPCIEDALKSLNQIIETCPIPQNEIKGFKINAITKLNYSGVYEDLQYGLKLEIKDGKITPNGYGYELYARAWKLDGTPLGLGANGKIEWERFVFPINNTGNLKHLKDLVITDPLGSISVVYNKVNSQGNPIIETRKYREDPKAVVLKQLAHTIKVSASNKLPIAGTFGNTTSTFRPDPGDPGTTTADTYYLMPDLGAGAVSWATIRTITTGIIVNSDTADILVMQMMTFTTTNTWKRLCRAIMTFNTGPTIPDTDEISAAVLSIYGVSKSDGLGLTPNVDIYAATPASNNTFVAADFNATGGSTPTSQTGSPNTYASWTAGAFNDFTFNATGRGNVSKTGVSKFATRNATYDADAATPTWSSDTSSQMIGDSADQADVTNDPKLVVTYTAAAPASTLETIWDDFTE